METIQPPIDTKVVKLTKRAEITKQVKLRAIAFAMAHIEEQPLEHIYSCSALGKFFYQTKKTYPTGEIARLMKTYWVEVMRVETLSGGDVMTYAGRWYKMTGENLATAELQQARLMSLAWFYTMVETNEWKNL